MTRWASLVLIITMFSGASRAACLPTLGTEDCPRMWDLRAQAIEHKYLDVPIHEGHPKHLNRHPRKDK